MFHKAVVGFDDRPLTAEVIAGLQVGPSLSLHQVGDDNRRAARYPRLTVHHHIANRQVAVDKLDARLEVRLDEDVVLVFDVHLLMIDFAALFGLGKFQC